jgi:hypothetical protein
MRLCVLGIHIRKLATRKETVAQPICTHVVCREERCEVLACFHVVVKMYRYSLEERVFIVKTYWITGSIKNCQRRFVEQFGCRNPPSKPSSGTHCIFMVLPSSFWSNMIGWIKHQQSINLSYFCVV